MASASELKLPISFCQAKQTRVRLPGDAVEGDPEVWRVIEDDWAAFWRPRGQERLELSGKAAVNGWSLNFKCSNVLFILKCRVVLGRHGFLQPTQR